MVAEKAPVGVVVLVSDDNHVREGFRYGCPDDIEVRFAADAREAWSLMSERPPSLVIVAIRSGSAGGVGLARDMSQHRSLKDVPILMLLERAQDTWLARQAGADDTVVQPVSGRELVERSLSLLN